MNFPADILPMYTASMSSERSFASWIAFSPASIPRSRKERSHNSPNSVSPTPMIATSRIGLGLPHQDLAAVLRIGCVINEDLVRDHVLDRRRRIASDLRDLVRDREIEAVGTCAAAVADREDPVSRLGLVQDRAEAHHDRAAVRVPDLPHAEARVHLRFLEAELLRDPDRELSVRLVEDRVIVILRGGAGPFEEELSAVDDVLEVRGFAGEATAVARIPLAFAPPEVRGVGRVRDGVADVRDRRGGLEGGWVDFFAGPRPLLRGVFPPPPPPRAAAPPPPAVVFGSDRVRGVVPAVAHDACLHAIRSSLEMSSPWSRSVRARMMLSNSASFTARSSMFSGCTYTTIAGFIGWALIAIIGERPYLTPVKKRALSLVDP